MEMGGAEDKHVTGPADHINPCSTRSLWLWRYVGWAKYFGFELREQPAAKVTLHIECKYLPLC